MPGNPENELNDLRYELQTSEAKLSEETKKRDELKSEITVLEKLVNEAKQVSNAYGQTLQNIKTEKEAIESYSQTMTPIIEAAIGDKKKAVDDTVAKFNDDLNKMGKEIEDLRKKVEGVNTQLEDVKKNHEQKQNDYNSLKTSQVAIQERMKELKSLKNSIEKEEGKKIGNKYFLISELNNLLKNTEIKSQEELKSKLYEASNDLDSAKAALKEKEDQVKTTKNEFEGKQNELESLKKNRRAKILEGISNI